MPIGERCETKNVSGNIPLFADAFRGMPRRGPKQLTKRPLKKKAAKEKPQATPKHRVQKKKG